MKLGIFDLEVVKCRHGFRSVFRYLNRNILSSKIFPTKQEALAHGTKKLEKLFQDALDQLMKTRYQVKSKPVNAIQWFPGTWLDGEKVYDVGKIVCRDYVYCDQCIKQGDWIVGDKIVTNEEFERDYEVIQ